MANSKFVEGLELLPEDLEFLDYYGQRSCSGAVWERYRKVWIEAMEAEPCEWKKQNAGRREANRRLRELDLRRGGKRKGSYRQQKHKKRKRGHV